MPIAHKAYGLSNKSLPRGSALRQQGHKNGQSWRMYRHPAAPDYGEKRKKGGLHHSVTRIVVQQRTKNLNGRRIANAGLAQGVQQHQA